MAVARWSKPDMVICPPRVLCASFPSAGRIGSADDAPVTPGAPRSSKERRGRAILHCYRSHLTIKVTGRRCAALIAHGMLQGTGSRRVRLAPDLRALTAPDAVQDLADVLATQRAKLAVLAGCARPAVPYRR